MSNIVDFSGRSMKAVVAPPGRRVITDVTNGQSVIEGDDGNIIIHMELAIGTSLKIELPRDAGIGLTKMLASMLGIKKVG